MMKSIKAIVLTGVLICGGLAYAQETQSWGDSGAEGMRQSANTAPDSPARFTTDGNAGTSWRLRAGETSGWLEYYWSGAKILNGAELDCAVPEGASINVYALDGVKWVPMAGASIVGPSDGKVSLSFPSTISPTEGALLRVSGVNASGIRVREVVLDKAEPLSSFGKIKPKSYSFNLDEYISIKADRLWDNLVSNPWFEPMWSIPWDVSQNDKTAASKVFAPYMGNPSKDAEIIWELDGAREIDTIKAYFIQNWRCVRFEFWNGAGWDNRVTIGPQTPSGNQTGWQRLSLAKTVTTNRVRVTFPGGWEQARFIGEIEVWGNGLSKGDDRFLPVSEIDSDGYSNFTIDSGLEYRGNCVLPVQEQDRTVEVCVSGISQAPLEGDWNGYSVNGKPSAWINSNTVYRLSVAKEYLREGTQFLRLRGNGKIQSVCVRKDIDLGRIPLTGSIADGFRVNDDTESKESVMPFTQKTLTLDSIYELESIRIFSKSVMPPKVSSGIRGSAGGRVEISWTSSGDGWWYARLQGVRADEVSIACEIPIRVDEIELFGTRANDRKLGIEYWWPSAQAQFGRLSDATSVIGWLGDPSVSPLVCGCGASQSDRVFWLPVSRIEKGARNGFISITGKKDGKAFNASFPIKEGKNDDTLDQGEDFLQTDKSSIRLSGSVKLPKSVCLINGKEIPISSVKTFSVDVQLRGGFQRITVEIRNNSKTTSYWVKEVYRPVGLPSLTLDSPLGDCFTQASELTLSGSVGGGIGLTLTVNGQNVPVALGRFERRVALQEGVNSYAFIVTDPLGRKYARTVKVTRDSASPKISILSPIDGSNLANQKVSLSVRSEEAGILAADGATLEYPLWWKVNEEAWEFDTKNPRIVDYTLADGHYSWLVTAQDGAGNVSEPAKVDFVVDVTPPEAFEISANVSGWTANKNPVLEFATTDATSGLAKYEYCLDGGEWAQAKSPLPLRNLADGEHRVFVRAIDKAGNVRMQSLVVGTDTTAPLPFTLTANVSGWSNDPRPILAFAATDATSGVARYEMRLDGGDWVEIQPNYRFDGLTDGIHKIVVRAVDQAGNESSDDLEIKTDSTPPEAFAIEANITGWSNNKTPTIKFATVDKMSGMSRFEVSIDGGAWVARPSGYVVPALTDGEHTASVRAIDNAGNIRLVSLPLQIDTLPPVAVTNCRLIPGKNTMEGLWETTDSDIKTYHVERKDGDVVTMFDTDKISFMDSSVSSGTVVSITVQPEDRAGNLGPKVEAYPAIVGIAVKPLDQKKEKATLIEYENLKLVVPSEGLPDAVKAVMVTEIQSKELEELSVNPIVGPIYSFTTLWDNGNGNLAESAHTEFDKEVLVTLTYDERLVPNGFPESNLDAYYYDNVWGRWFKVEKAGIDIEHNTIYFLTNHFTNFSVQPTMLEDLSPEQLRDAGHRPDKTESRAGEVTVSPQGGTMMTESTEFVLNGKNGYKYPIKRIYDSQTARIDSPSLNACLSIGFNFGPDLPAQIASQLVSIGTNIATSQLKSKLLSYFKKNGDYNLAMGIGWRLNLPYIFTDNTSVMVRLPEGGYYPINQMDLKSESNVLSGWRSMEFENHWGDDFTLRITQVRADITDAAVSAAFGNMPGQIKNVMDKIGAGEGFSVTGLISLASSLIPNWVTVSSELILKDGTTYVFDSLGRIVSITDPSKTNVIGFEYLGLQLSKIIDPLGNAVLFEYNHSDFESLFLRPCITSITAPSFGGDVRKASFQYDPSDFEANAFMTLPPMISAIDVGGRRTQYEIDKRFLFSGGGSVKANFLSLLLDIIPGASFVKSLVGMYTITLSGHICCEWPRLISSISAPGLGKVVINYENRDLSTITADPCDYFLGLFPTALRISYEFLYKLVTSGVTVVNGDLSSNTAYSYDFDHYGSQWMVTKATIDNGLKVDTQVYSMNYKSYNRYVSIDDAIVSVLQQGLFTEKSNREETCYSLLDTTTSAKRGSTVPYETVKYTWDKTHNRRLSETTTRGSDFTRSITYAYDDWGNETKRVLRQSTTLGNTSSTTESWYKGTSSVKPTGYPDGIPVTLNQSVKETKNLLLGRVTKYSLPEDSFENAETARYEGFAYDATGRQIWNGVYNGDHWAGIETKYHPFTREGDPVSGRVSETVSATGHRTVIDYDTSSVSSKKLLVEKRTEVGVRDPDGSTRDVVSEVAYDTATGWVRYAMSPTGFVTETSYDSLGRPVSINRPGDETPSASCLAAVRRVKAPCEKIVYDDTARTVSVYKGMANGSTYAYPTEAAEKYEYDRRMNLVRRYIYDRSGASVVTALTELAYDGYGRAISMTDPIRHTTGYSHDFLNRPTKVVYPDGTSVSYAYFDESGIREITNERGKKTREWLNWEGKSEKSVVDFEGLQLSTRTLYNGIGMPAVIVNPKGEATLVEYSPFGKESRIVKPEVETFSPRNLNVSAFPVMATVKTTPVDTIEYSDDGLPTKKTSGAGNDLRTVEYAYNGLSNVIVESADGRESWTWYDGAGNPVKKADPEAVKAIKVNGMAAYTAISYTSRNKQRTVTDPAGAVTTYAYDRDDRVISMSDPRAVGNRVDDFTIRYTYDDFGRLIKGDLPPVPGVSARGTVTIAYDLRGNATKQVAADGLVTEWTYDARNRKTTQTVTGTGANAPKSATGWVYDACGNVVEEVIGNNPTDADPTKWTGVRKTQTWDGANRLTRTDFPDGQVAESEYDELGRVTATKDAVGSTVRHMYNTLGKETRRVEPLGKTTDFLYNPWGDLTGTILRNVAGGGSGDQVWAREYDKWSQITNEINNAGQSWQYAYDDRGLVTSVTDPSGTVMTNSWSVTGLLIGETRLNGSKTGARSWSYDPAGFMYAANDNGVSTAINAQGGTYTANAWDLAVSYATVVDGISMGLSYTFDSGLRPTQMTYPDGASVRYAYDGLGRLKEIPGYASNGSYNFMGSLVSLNAPNGTSRTKEWDSVKGTLNGYSWNLASIAPRAIQWDTRGNILQISKGDASNVYYYDDLNRLVNARDGGPVESSVKDQSSTAYIANVRDVGGRLPPASVDGNQRVAFDMAAQSVGVNLDSVCSVNKLRLNGTGERITKRTLEVYLRGSGSDAKWERVDDYTFIRDREGVTLSFAAPKAAQYVKLHSTWDERDDSYAPVDRHSVEGRICDLLDVWYITDGQTTNWSFDSLGNRLEEVKTKARTSRKAYEYYANTNRLKACGEWEFNYDANGNLSERGTDGVWDASTGSFVFDTSVGTLWSYEYDLYNRLVAVRKSAKGTDSLVNVARYVYDIRGLRVESIKQGSVAYTQYDASGDIIWRKDGELSIRYVQALGETWAETRVSGAISATFWHHTDHEGTSEVITDSTGSIVWEASYEAYGAVIRTNATMSFTPSYTGKEFDSDIGLYYYNARWYDPDLGRFITEDPARDGVNWFAYCNENPIRYIDPTGLEGLGFTNVWESAKSALHWNNKKEYLDTAVSEASTGIRGLIPNEARLQTANTASDLAVDITKAEVDLTITAASFLLPVGSAKVAGNLGLQALKQAGISGVTAGLTNTVLQYVDTGKVDLAQVATVSGTAAAFGGATTIAGGLFQKALQNFTPAATKGTGRSYLNFKDMASEAQVEELLSGQGRPLAGAGNVKGKELKVAGRLAADYGGNESDWAKVGSSNYKAIDGTSFETHAYQNLVEKLLVELKTKFQ
jgi:RHS repeat-associated protein